VSAGNLWEFTRTRGKGGLGVKRGKGEVKRKLKNRKDERTEERERGGGRGGDEFGCV
jgi:hypothetical protein